MSQTAEQKQNLILLRDHLQTVDRDKFDMDWFMLDEDDQHISLHHHEAIHNCGSAACAIGYGPAAGVKVIETDKEWDTYSERVFGFSCLSDAWNFMFSGVWTSYDNTPEGAARRINYVIEHGQPPVGWDHEDPKV